MMETEIVETGADKSIADLGFCKLNFIGKDKIEALRKLYTDQLTDEKVDGMMVSHNRGDYRRNLFISEAINDILEDELAEHFPNHRFFVAHFIVKEAGNNNSFQLHQDWNIVDEGKYSSYQLWLPLQFSYPENGGMFFIPRSQHFSNALRSGSFGIPRVPITPEIYPNLSYTRLHPGQAVVFSNNVLHGSFSNATPENRLSVLVNIVHKDAPTIYYHMNEGQQQTEIYPLDARGLFQHLPELEKGINPFTVLPEAVLPLTKQNNEAISLQNIFDWIVKDRAALDLPVDYEFKQNQILKDESIERKLNQNGYAVINLLTEHETAELMQGVERYFPDRNKFTGRYSSMDQQDSVMRKEIHNYIQSIINERLQLFFKDYYCPISIYYCKRADGVKDLDWHTDPHFMLNQHLEPFYAVWCPLMDVNERNGVLQVAAGSHRILNSLVHIGRKWPFKEHRDILEKYHTTFNLKAGQAIVFDARLVHTSTTNVSDKERVCVVMRITHKNSDFFSVTTRENGTLGEMYSQNQDYFYCDSVVDHLNQAPVTGINTGNYYFFDEKVSPEAIAEKLSKHVSNTQPQ